MNRATGITEFDSMALIPRMVVVTGDWSIFEPGKLKGNFASSLLQYLLMVMSLCRSVDDNMAILWGW